MKESINTILLSVSTALATLCWLTFANPNMPANTSADVVKAAAFDKVTGSEGYLGQIIMFGGDFAPRNWAFCNGQMLSINENTALFSILGTTYGGDGRTTFALPDLRGRTPVHAGNGPGLNRVQLGQKMGVEKATPSWTTASLKTATTGEEFNVITSQQAPISREQPSTGINYIISVVGVFPPRS